VVLARQFGLEAVGTLTLATVVIVAVSLFGTFGLPYVLAKMDAPIGQLNRIGALAALAVVPLSLPVIALFSVLMGHDRDEAYVIAVLCLGGAIFAQTNIASALQVLQRKEWQTLIPPVANLAGLMVAWGLTSTLLSFAALTIAFRFAGVATAFLLLPGERVGSGLVLRAVRSGSAYLTADAINLSTDQAIVFILATLLSRADLGLVGLCRQFLTACDTPGWSMMQSRYPALVRNLEAEFRVLLRSMMKTGVLMAVAASLAAVPLAYYVFNAPSFAYLGPLLMSSVPLRYFVMMMEIKLRAAGATGAANMLSLIRGAIGLTIVPLAGLAAGALGAICGMIVSVALGAVVGWRMIRRLRVAPMMAEGTVT
jgi:O-antigen/teichoic acid export membrane protein